jgi:hypothetical protein
MARFRKQTAAIQEIKMRHMHPCSERSTARDTEKTFWIMLVPNVHLTDAMIQCDVFHAEFHEN